MGSSQTVYIDANAEEILKGPCFPISDFNRELFEYTSFKIDVGIDESLLRYSGTDSTVKLQDYSNQLRTELGSNLPDYVGKVGDALAGFTPVPNAVGIGALAISMILHFCFFASKQSTSKEPNPEDMLRRVFAEEKSSEVRDLMEHYLNRYRMYVKQEQRLLQETKRVEEQLGSQLTRLKNSMLADGHMSDRALKHWTNGAAFRAQMLIHIARLKKKEGASEFENAKISARSAIDTYNKHLHDLIEKYKTYKASEVVDTGKVIMAKWTYLCCALNKCCTTKCDLSANPDDGGKQFLSDIFSVNRQIAELQKYFSDLQKNFAVLTDQLGTFKVPRN